MKLVCVRKIDFFPKGSDISSAHYTLFHGLASRTGNFLAYTPSDVLDEESKDLHLVINLFKLAPIIQPRTNLLLQNDAKHAIKDLPGAIWKRTIVERVCEIPYRVGEPVALGEGSEFTSISSEREILRRSKLATTQSRDIPIFFELVVPALEPLIENSKQTETLNLEFPLSQEESELKISHSILSKFPITWWYDGYHVFHERAFSLVSRYFDHHYFETVTVELPD